MSAREQQFDANKTHQQQEDGQFPQGGVWLENEPDQ
jgi:hypothetical protein